jgi:hypothetical protein
LEASRIRGIILVNLNLEGYYGHSPPRIISRERGLISFPGGKRGAAEKCDHKFIFKPFKAIFTN